MVCSETGSSLHGLVFRELGWFQPHARGLTSRKARELAGSPDQAAAAAETIRYCWRCFYSLFIRLKAYKFL